MIKGKGKIVKVDGILQDEELRTACRKLPDGMEYDFLIVDHKRNRNLPSLSYLFSVVLKYLSDTLADHPDTKALYRYFEEIFAPQHTCTINGQRFAYQDLKSERIVDVDNFIERVVNYSKETWGIIIPDKEELKDQENREYYSQAYLNQEADWSSFISSRNKR